MDEGMVAVVVEVFPCGCLRDAERVIDDGDATRARLRVFSTVRVLMKMIEGKEEECRRRSRRRIRKMALMIECWNRKCLPESNGESGVNDDYGEFQSVGKGESKCDFESDNNFGFGFRFEF
ncbi:hypothetical protein PIB30_041733 [Stylosanthes scabra]|uniref:Uncharacterized protein n=1 Tax=Stylosanthes scabra TaxID=79078 RepID=A0ABU6ZDT1_9FABA|nr:hypothetical protein [Stylosanthes scabra]